MDTDVRQALLDAFTQPRRKAHLCLADGCSTIVIDRYCWRHRKPDVWSEMRRTLDELNQHQDDGERE